MTEGSDGEAGHATGRGGQSADPKGLIREAYRIEGITEAECRSIFLDWALSLAPGEEARFVLPELIAHYADPRPDHPMSSVLRAGLATQPTPRRRGGWRRARRGAGEG